MRVVHVIPSIARSEGGPSEVIRKLRPVLQDQGIDVRVVTTDKDAGSSDRDLLEQPDVHYATSWTRRWTFSPGIVSLLWREIGASDLVHVHSVHSFPSTAALVIARLRARNVLLQPHGALNAYHLNQRRALKLGYLRIIDGWALPAVTAALYSSTIEARDGAVALRQIPSLHLPLGIDDRILDQPRSEGRAPRVLFLARLAKKKRVELFISALASEPLSSFELDAVIAGPIDADLRNSPAELIRAAGVGHRVRVVGQVGEEERARLFASSAIYVLPSDDESFGMSVAEAMGSGCAVITSPHVGVAIDASDAEAAVIVAQDPVSIASEIAALLNDPDARLELSDRARAYARDNLTWGQIGKLLAEYYLEYALAREPRPEGRR